MCGYLEEYVEATAKMQKSHSKDVEKVLKTISQPLREGHHFDPTLGGINGMFENFRNNTKGIANMYTETEMNLKGVVMPVLERLHKEIKNKFKELEGGAVKGSKIVAKARAVTTKHVEMLGHHAATLDAVAWNKIEPNHDPYVLRRLVNHKLNKQIIEENNNRQDTIAVQNSFQDFEAHVVQTVQTVISQFILIVGGQTDRQRAMYADMQAATSNIPAEFEWINFMNRNETVLIDPDSPPRLFANATFPNQDHTSTKALIEGSLERKSRTLIRGYQNGYYVVTLARYLHEFKDNDDFQKEPSPELSLYLPDCIIGGLDGVAFKVKGKDVSNGKVGNAFQTSTELSFKAHTSSDAQKWWKVIKDAIGAPGGVHSGATPISPIATDISSGDASPTVSRQGTVAATNATTAITGDRKPATAETKSPAEATSATEAATGQVVAATNHKTDVQISGIERTASTASHFYGPPGGTSTEKS
jgi:hypothetical protein